MSLQDKDFLAPLQKAIYARLSGAGITYENTRNNPSTTDTVPVVEKPEPDQAFPFIMAGEIISTIPKNTKDRIGKELVYTAHVLSDYHGIKEAAEIANKAVMALTSPKLDLVADGLAVVVSKLQGSQARELSDGLTIDYQIQFFFLIYEAVSQTA